MFVEEKMRIVFQFCPPTPTKKKVRKEGQLFNKIKNWQNSSPVFFRR